MGSELGRVPDSIPKVLIVDDTPANLLAFSTILEDQGYQVIQAQSGKEALKLMHDHEFAVILLDVRMPEMDGIETAKYMRIGRGRLTPIIFISAYDRMPIQVERGYLAGAIDYLFSPVDEEILKRKVAAFIEFHLQNTEYRRLSESLAVKVSALEEQIRVLEQLLTAFGHPSTTGINPAPQSTSPETPEDASGL